MSFDSLFCALIITGALYWSAILVRFIFNVMEALINCWSFSIHLSYVNDEFEPFSESVLFDVIQNNFRCIEFHLEFKPNRILNIILVLVTICLRICEKFAELVIQNFDNIQVIVCAEYLFEFKWAAPSNKIKTE